jgi:hypothetical protein
LKKKIISLALAPLVAVGLAGCSVFGPSEEELQLIADCETVYSNMANTGEWPESVDMEFWGDTYAVTNAGIGSRAKAKQDIENMFPWMGKAMATVVERNSWAKFQESLSLHEGYATALAVNELTEGTSLAPYFTDADLESFVTDEDAHYYAIEDAIKRLYEPYEEGSLLGACPEYTSDSYVDGFEERFRGTIGNARHAAEQYRVLLACELNGAFDGDKCAAEDYVYEGSSEPLEPRNPFLEPFADETTQGLAEFAWCWNLGLEVNPDRTGCW